ncbi:hypothetical protein [Archangium violaceum]|uniref:hypothetical protein n=1 Tax=Archangium violaceum TaxID=83451 RepID=UPI0036DB6C11
MVRQGWKSLALAGLLGVLGLGVGCDERGNRTVREEARKAGQAVDQAAEDARKSAEEARETTHEAVEGFKEGLGGSGQQQDTDGGGERQGEEDERR